MVDLAGVLGTGLVALALVLTPGPNMVYLVSQAVTHGRRTGFVALLGVATGFLGYLVAAVVGIASLFAVVPALYVGLKLVGAAYLLLLAWRTIRRPVSVPPTAGEVAAPVVARRVFAMGAVTNLLNPKIAVLYVSLLPQFVDPGRGSVALQSLVLGLVQITVAVTVNAAIVLGAGGLAGFLRRHPAWDRTQRYLSGTVLAGLAVRVALDRSRAAAPA